MTTGFQMNIQIKNMSRIALLNYIRRNGHTTKAELAAKSGLTYMAVKKIMEELAELELVRKDDIVRGQVGRKAATYTINEHYGYTVGLHINIFKTLLAVMDLRGKIISKVELDMERVPEDPSELIGQILNGLEEVIQKSGVDKHKLLGIGIASPGPVNPKEGMILSPPNLPHLRYLPIVKIVEERHGLPVLLCKDTNAIAMGEFWRGAGASHENMVYIDADMGIGSGLIVMGALQEGHNFVAGEFGHITIDPNGPLCNCGNIGCLEAMASGIAMLRDARQRIASMPSHPLYKKVDSLSIQQMLHAGLNGDLVAISIINKAAYHMGNALASLINILDPEVIIMGGVLVLEYEPYLNIVRDRVLQRRLPGVRDNILIRTQCGQTAGVVGAGEVVANHFFSHVISDILSKGNE